MVINSSRFTVCSLQLLARVNRKLQTVNCKLIQFDVVGFSLAGCSVIKRAPGFISKLNLLIIFCVFTFQLHGEEQKVVYNATRIFTPPRIDGQLNDSCWKSAAVATSFITYSPEFGKPASLRTEARLVYDDNAIYVSAYCYDDHPEGIRNQLGERESYPDADVFAVGLDTYDDDINGYRFELSAANVQGDVRLSQSNIADKNWDAVWHSRVSIVKDGWIVEIKIPFSAIRFPEKAEQQWGLQFARSIKRLNEYATWSPVNPKINGIVNQWGVLTGLGNLSPPVRLSFSPYVSTGMQHDPVSTNPTLYNTNYSLNGGMDVKYGINESFTLDMTLIPDFGQVQSDNVVLNLSAFETKFDEKRTFFTEGTELFHQGDPNFRDGTIFYSRRIGGRPTGYFYVDDSLDDGEEIIKNPSESQLYNATKLTGRTNKGLGIGFFNAVTAPMYATIRNTETGETRKIQTAVLNNYNILVFDQSLKNNSHVSFTNTNVMREGASTDGNVSAINFNIKDKSNTYSVSGFANYSQRYNQSFEKNPTTGYYYTAIFSKISGNFQFDYFNAAISKDYNQRDLGIQNSKNEFSNFFGVKYLQTKAKGYLFSWDVYATANYTTRLEPITYQELQLNWGGNTQLKNFWYAGVYFSSKPTYYYDYYDPRVEGAKYTHGGYWFGGMYINTDDRKRLALNVNLGYGESSYPDDPYREIKLNPVFRVNDHLRLSYDLFMSEDKGSFGYVDVDSTGQIIYGLRLLHTVTNTFTAQYAFTSKMNVSLRARYYWSKVNFARFYNLNEDGTVDYSNFTGNYDENFNAFNLDMIYNWEFAPGSRLSIAWKNNIEQDDNFGHDNYFSNFHKTFNTAQSNGLSAKLIYYLDYQYLKRKNG